MFTGIITEIGKVVSIQRRGKGVMLRIKAPANVRELNVNDSVSINGVCQTVVEKSKDTFDVVAVEETLKKTTLRNLKVGELVNLELAMKMSDRFGGHIVLGHIDCVGLIRAIEKETVSWLFTISFPSDFRKFVISVGSIAIDGVSLTIAGVENNSFVVSIIQHTFKNTIFQNKKINDKVNLEFDVLGKYIENILINIKKNDNAGKLNLNKLKLLGY